LRDARNQGRGGRCRHCLDGCRARIRRRRSLDGGGNNVAHPTWGQVGQPYSRIAPATYADGVGKPLSGTPARRVSNRIFNDGAQNLFSENGVTQWGFVWGQFLDHTFGLREETGGEPAPIAFDAHDPLETFRNDFGAIDFTRSPAAAGTGAAGVPREQINTVSSYIDGWAAARTSGSSGCARAPSTATSPTTARTCYSTRAGCCRGAPAEATPRARPRWSCRGDSPPHRRRRWWPATSVPTRTSR
jgi:hypothetical protein